MALASVRAPSSGTAGARVADLPNARALVVDSERIALTPLEFGVTQQRWQHKGKVETRASLLSEVWGYSCDGGSDVVDMGVRAHRGKLGDQASMIETVVGAGYRLREQD